MLPEREKSPACGASLAWPVATLAAPTRTGATAGRNVALGAKPREHSGMRTLGRVLAVSCLLGSTAYADSLDDQLGPREIAVGEAMRGGAVGATGISLNPS